MVESAERTIRLSTARNGVYRAKNKLPLVRAGLVNFAGGPKLPVCILHPCPSSLLFHLSSSFSPFDFSSFVVVCVPGLSVEECRECPLPRRLVNPCIYLAPSVLTWSVNTRISTRQRRGARWPLASHDCVAALFVVNF